MRYAVLAAPEHKLYAGVDFAKGRWSASTGVYIFVIEGLIKTGDTTLDRRDGIGITEVARIDIEALENSEFLLIEIAQ